MPVAGKQRVCCFLFETEGPGGWLIGMETEFLGADSGKRAVSAAGDFPVGHRAKQGQFIGRPFAVWAEQVKAAAETFRHFTPPSGGLGPTLNAAKALGAAFEFGRAPSFAEGRLFGEGFWGSRMRRLVPGLRRGTSSCRR
jgi:hypothetical protein